MSRATDETSETAIGRRSFLSMSAGVVAAAGLRSAAGLLDPPFRHGVASGDPTTSAVIIWTRLTPMPDATPGSGIGPVVDVAWEVATDESFSTIVASGTTTAGPATDHTVHIDVTGLAPDTYHWYRFRSAGTTSPVGRTRTAAAASVDAVRIGVVTCAEWEFGRFGAYGRLAERDDVDVVLHLGDYIYEFGLGYGPAASPGDRTHEPPHEIVTLADYRTRYAQYHGDVGSLAMHAAHPVICMYDDHEIANDTWREGAENHDPGDGEGDFADRAAAARQAWREWLPVRVNAADPETVHREFRFGDLVHLWMVDERRYRDAPPASGPFSIGSADPAIEDPSRTMLGLEQRAWLLDGMAASDAAWKVLGNPVPFIPQNVGPEITNEMKLALGPFTENLPVNRPAYYIDDWNGWVGERNVIFEAWDSIDDVVVLTGDYHESFASDLPKDQGSYVVDGASVAVEFVTPSVTSPGYSETISLAGAPAELATFADTLFVANFTTSNPWIKYHEGFSNGYGVVEFTTTRTQFDFHFLADRARDDSAAPVAASWYADRGDPHVLEAATPLGARTRTGQLPETTTNSSAPAASTGPAQRLPETGGDQPLVPVAAAALAGLAAALGLRRRRAIAPHVDGPNG